MLHNVFVVFHIVAWSAAIIFGNAALVVYRCEGSRTIMGAIYHWLFMIFAMSACLWAILDWLQKSWILSTSL